MENCEFDYGAFVAGGKNTSQENAPLGFEGEFKPVRLNESQKARLRKIAVKAAKINAQNEARARKRAEEREYQRQLEEDKKIRAATKVRHPIGMKLIGIISAIVIIALGGVTYLVSYFVSADTRTSAEENNLTINTRTANDCENRIATVVSASSTFLDIIAGSNGNDITAREYASKFYERNPEIMGIILPDLSKSFFNIKFLGENEISFETAEAYLSSESESVEKAQNGNFVIRNASAYFTVPVLALIYPSSEASSGKVTVVLYSAEKMAESFSSGSINLSSFLDDYGKVLISPDYEQIMNEADFSENPIVKQMLESKESNMQISFVDTDGEEYIGAFRKIGYGNCGVVTVVKTSIILEGVNTTTRRNLYLTVAILSVVIMIVWFFAKSLSVPLKQLTAVVNEINQGNFNTDLFNELEHKHHDEIGVLIKSTKHEREILNTFTKLTNKGVTQAIIRKEIDFEPHLKDITIFFSDIRGFTAISDGFKNRFGERSAAEIISFLNDYMSRMVGCITRTGGVVDKFEGDAIMACWGVLRQEPLDWEKLPDTDPSKAEFKAKHDQYVKEDALAAVKASLAMRYSLMKYNKDAEAFSKAHANEKDAAYKPYIKIGRGLNSGRATVGFMGSFDKMEFTSIGDSVNFASRTEASNKPCGTDMLITEDTYNILKYDYIKCPENHFFIKPENRADEILVEKIPVEFEVKGKGKQHFYGVVNMPQFDIKDFFGPVEPGFEVDSDCEACLGPNGPKTIEEVRKLLGIDTPDFAKVNLDEEENKIQVASK